MEPFHQRYQKSTDSGSKWSDSGGSYVNTYPISISYVTPNIVHLKYALKSCWVPIFRSVDVNEEKFINNFSNVFHHVCAIKVYNQTAVSKTRLFIY